MKSGPEGLHIRVRSLTGGPAEEITFKNLTERLLISRLVSRWKGNVPSDVPILRVSMLAWMGDSQVLWKRGSGPGFGHLTIPFPRLMAGISPVTVVTAESNAWMVENF